jgi:hypothetical protein
MHILSLFILPSRKQKKTTDLVAPPIVPDKKWLKMLYNFIYFRTNGVTIFDRGSSNPIEVTMSYWIEEQNDNLRQLNDGELLDDSPVRRQIAVLNSIRFPFERSQKARRNANLDALHEFKEEHGHLNVPQRMEGGLGKYVAKLCEEYKLPQDERVALTPDLLEELSRMGFLWSVKKSNAEAWADNFDLLVQWKNQNGHCKIPRDVEKLGKWVQDQRRKKKEGRLTEEQEEKLKSIGFLWTGR